MFKNLRYGLLPFFQTEQEIQQEWELDVASYLIHPKIVKKINSLKIEFVNAIKEFEKTIHNQARDLKNKKSQILILDWMMKHKHKKKNFKNLLPALSNKENVYMSVEVRDIV